MFEFFSHLIQAPPKSKKNAPVDITKLDIRVGKITKVGPHPEADSLLVEEIDVGETRTVVCGLAKFYKPEEMQGRLVCAYQNFFNNHHDPFIFDLQFSYPLCRYVFSAT